MTLMLFVVARFPVSRGKLKACYFTNFFALYFNIKESFLKLSIEKHFADPTYYSTNNLINITLSFPDKD